MPSRTTTTDTPVVARQPHVHPPRADLHHPCALHWHRTQHRLASRRPATGAAVARTLVAQSDPAIVSLWLAQKEDEQGDAEPVGRLDVSHQGRAAAPGRQVPESTSHCRLSPDSIWGASRSAMTTPVRVAAVLRCCGWRCQRRRWWQRAASRAHRVPRPRRCSSSHRRKRCSPRRRATAGRHDHAAEGSSSADASPDWHESPAAGGSEPIVGPSRS